MLTRKSVVISGICLILPMIVFGLFWSRRQRHTSPPSTTTSSSVQPIRVVAAENFWGSLVSQIGGSAVQVDSIVSDPNADPHEYESDAAHARAIADADYVIVNGAGYDRWADHLLSSGATGQRRVLHIDHLLSKQPGDNPHFWYSPDAVNQAAAQMEADLIALDPADAAGFKQRYQHLQTALGAYQQRIATIKQTFSGQDVAATEDIFAYLADAADLHLVSPPTFMQAVAEGNDPPADSVVQFEEQLKSGRVRALVYNLQTVTPLTERIKKLAADQGIPVIGVSETMQPVDANFQNWMDAQLLRLQAALTASAPKK